jgi:opacity protein-like surface antigen
MLRNGPWGAARAARAKLIAAGIAAAGTAVAGVASAADMPPLKAPAIKAPYNWSGCFVGGFFGWGDANDWRSTDLGNFANTPAANAPGPGTGTWLFSLNDTPTGGGYVGCQWQPTPGGGFVFGVEGEGGYLNLIGPGQQPLAVVFPNVGGPTNITDLAKIGSGYGLVAGRVGWVFFEKIHVYGKVGVAFYNESSVITDANLPGGPVIARGSKSQTPLAWGGGAEYPLTEHWIGKAEYLVFERGSSYTAVGVGPAAGFSWKEDSATVQTFKLGAAYKF